MTDTFSLIPDQVSVVIPVYNEERCLRETLESVVNQADCVLLGDNASTDGTEAICREYAERYAHIRYFRHATNLGSAENTVLLAKNVETEYAMQMGAHDILPANYVSTLKSQLTANPGAVCAYGNCAYLELDGTISRTLDFASVRADMYDDNPYIRAASFFRGNQPWDLIFGFYRSRSVIPIIMEMKSISGCDHFLVVAALVEGKFFYTPETTFLRRMAHPNDTDKDYMARIVGDHHSNNMSRDYTAIGKQMLDWFRKHRTQKPLSPEQEKTFKDLLFQMALKFDTPTDHPFWNCVFFLRRHWRKWYKFIKCKFVPGYAERKNL